MPMKLKEYLFKYNVWIKHIIFKFLFIICIVSTINFFDTKMDQYITQHLSEIFYLNQSIKSFLEMMVAIYAAVISILATSRTSITEQLSKLQITDSFIVTISFGFIECILAIFLTSLKMNGSIFFESITYAIISLSIIYIIHFAIIIIRMFSLTVENAYFITQEDKKKQEHLMNTLEKIERNISKLK